jgi:biotin-(acetyl-CoA carboxylase) ligase
MVQGADGMRWGGPGYPLQSRVRLPSSTEIVLALLPAIDSFVQLDQDAILRLFQRASSYACGRRVTVEQPDGAIEGTTAGLDPSGFLIVRKDDGTDTLVLAGGVRAAGS